ncbi:hypothetical protein SAMN05428965_1415 [Geodermatophilus sp. DSM 45219]|nr:hypothetical protein SAMN05428965_1415 [Geodermatophilus sp. DSM 45219]
MPAGPVERREESPDLLVAGQPLRAVPSAARSTRASPSDVPDPVDVVRRGEPPATARSSVGSLSGSVAGPAASGRAHPG